MAADWAMLQDLMTGTRAMREAGEAHMPRWPAEDPDEYAARLGTATLFPGFKRTAKVMKAKPFSRPLTFSDATPLEIKGREANPKADPPQEAIAGWADDIDLQGVNLHTFAAEMLLEALAYGLAGILVEAPQKDAGVQRTVAQEKAEGVRPYFVRVLHQQILGWKVYHPKKGVPQLTQLRLAETGTVDDGEWGEKPVKRVRVLRPGSWEIWEQPDEGGQFVKSDGGPTDLKRIPFVPIYGTRLAFMMGQSPLLDLAYLNVKHWQSQSDQDRILHVARVPVLFARGFQDDDDIKIGAANAIKTTAEKAELKWVEHTGAAIDAGKDSLADLEEQMIQAGAELLVKKPGTRTATETAGDAEANKSELQTIAEGLEDSLDQALQLMAELGGLKSGGNVTLYKDFGAATLGQASAQLVLSMQQSGLISKPTAINEMKRRGELAAEVDAAVEEGRVEAEGGGLGTITDDDVPDEDPDKTDNDPDA